MSDLTKADAVAALRRAHDAMPSGHAHSKTLDSQIKRDAAILRALADALEQASNEYTPGYWTIPAPRRP